jgi:sialic acid synthase SpsE
MLFIAEIGLNHNGNFGLVYELVRQAASSGADIAKFQLGWRCGAGEINRIDEGVLAHIIRCCDHVEIEPMFSIITDEAWELAKKFEFKRYKIASRTVNDNPALVEEIIATGKEVFISLGMWEGEGLPFDHADNVKYLWCKSNYPAHPWELASLPKDFTRTPFAGYSDHSVGLAVPLLAISRGAQVIEKHFTLDKSDVTIRDHALSATPLEFAELTRTGREIAKCLNLGV